MSQTVRMLDDLIHGTLCELQVMVCRKWDVITSYGTYKSTDYLFVDHKGNAIHCTSKKDVAHYFIDKLEVGKVFGLKGFEIHPNYTEYRLPTRNNYLMEIHGGSSVNLIEAPTENYNSHWFNLTHIQDVHFAPSNPLLEVIGYVTEVGPIITREIKQDPKPRTTQTVDFYLIDNSGGKIRATLWGDLAESFVRKKPADDVPWIVILVGMVAKVYKETYLSSTSATIIYDDKTIPLISEFGPMHMEMSLDSHSSDTTLAHLSQWCQSGKKATKFELKLTIASIDPKSPWYYYACSSGKCLKGVTRRHGKFYYQSCESNIDYPTPRFKLRLSVEDVTGCATLTLFDSTAESLLNTTVDSLLRVQHATKTEGSLPDMLTSLVHTTHLFEIPSQSYYPKFGDSYTCTAVRKISANVTEALKAPTDAPSENKEVLTTDAPTTSMDSVSNHATPSKMPTPSNPTSQTPTPPIKRRRLVLKSIDTEDSD